MPTHTLTNGTLSVSLPADLLWEDEFSHSPQKTSRTTTLDGGQWLEKSLQVVGRPITLAGSEERGWVPKSAVDTLYSMLCSTLGLTLTLADGRVFAVVWGDEPLQARSLFGLSLPTEDDWYVVRLQFFTR